MHILISYLSHYMSLKTVIINFELQMTNTMSKKTGDYRDINLDVFNVLQCDKITDVQLCILIKENVLESCNIQEKNNSNKYADSKIFFLPAIQNASLRQS